MVYKPIVEKRVVKHSACTPIRQPFITRQVLAEKTTNFKEQLAEPLGEQAEEIIKDPYIFNFIPNATALKEVELENELVKQIAQLLLEFGSGFAFMGR